ncbi:hypothetical protein GCM10009715_19240 [Paeniglutamicibacter psychrophenolicus]|uniref:site-specific DNA-methyltransferase (adenine-specific) n=1 Tax=Paeniglutamicibacter psychrophenolicus TaxID=257454 RepID=A0ABS4WJT4_9MICC|nr:DNA adenine methylase [Paeniglutamicibacter psychrophenolicus]MBP2376398.1 DNA adenine methylase/adenine-specific DNA-methyltransferase [Paeniglutamicibacter psychrophenolicus]
MTAPAPSTVSINAALAHAAHYPRLRYMGSKYKLAPQLASVFDELGGDTFLDAFSGSGFVGYLAKAMGFQVTSNDYMNYGRVIASAAICSNDPLLTREIIERITGPAADDRDFIQRTFDGVFFTADDRVFLDSAWSHIAQLEGQTKDMALAALILSAARKQPRGVFTISGDLSHYDDGRRDLRTPLREHFVEHAAKYNDTAFGGGLEHRAIKGDTLSLEETEYDIVYMDPPYAPPTDDADYTKRYHFLEGLSDYWAAGEIMQNTKTKKIPKRHSAFANKLTASDALRATFQKFAGARALVVSYSSNSVPGLEWMTTELGKVKSSVEVREVPHTYSFGTHGTAIRRQATEYIFIAKD